MALTRTYDGDEPVRINKWLGQSGVCSRREAESLIADGLVSIDGEVVRDAGRKIEKGQTLTLNQGGEEALSSGMTLMIHKPVGYVSGQPEPGKIPAVRLLAFKNRADEGPIPRRDESLPPIGRLDEDSRGLLMVSTDGVVAKAVIGPESDLDKEYLVRVEGQITQAKLDKLCHGLELDGRKLRPAKVTLIRGQDLKFILREGRKRQIRRMCELVGLEVIDLFRTRIGPIKLDGLKEGQWRHITPEERQALLTYKVQ